MKTKKKVSNKSGLQKDFEDMQARASDTYDSIIRENLILKRMVESYREALSIVVESAVKSAMKNTDSIEHGQLSVRVRDL